jgi:hypothetical protein
VPVIERDSLAHLWLRWIKQGHTPLLTVTGLATSTNPYTRNAARQVQEFTRHNTWRMYV